MTTDLTTSNAADDGQKSTFVLPLFPGEDPLAHQGTQWEENAVALLVGRGLMVVADGGMPAAANKYVDVDLSTLPVVRPGDRDYFRSHELRIRISFAFALAAAQSSSGSSSSTGDGDNWLPGPAGNAYKT